MFKIDNALYKFNRRSTEYRYYIIYLAALVKKYGLKDYEVKEENTKFEYVYYYTYFYGILKSNIKGLYLYDYGWNYGVDGITIVIRNKLLKEYGEVMYNLEKENREEYNKKIEYLYKDKNLILNIWGKNGYYWQFGKNKYNKISYIRLGYEDACSEDNIQLLFGLLEIKKVIENEIEEVKSYLKIQDEKKVVA